MFDGSTAADSSAPIISEQKLARDEHHEICKEHGLFALTLSIRLELYCSFYLLFLFVLRDVTKWNEMNEE